MNRAQDWNAFRAAASLFDVPAQNLIYADVDGNIGYQAPGHRPRARHAATAPCRCPAGQRRTAGRARSRSTTCPSMLNPERGYIVTANNAA